MKQQISLAAFGALVGSERVASGLLRFVATGLVLVGLAGPIGCGETSAALAILLAPTILDPPAILAALRPENCRSRPLGRDSTLTRTDTCSRSTTLTLCTLSLEKRRS
jgi:hypothetical protein